MMIDTRTGRIPTSLPSSTKDDAGTSTDAAGFSETLGKIVGAVESSGADANRAVSGMLTGTTDVHEAMIALQRADLTLQFSVQIRNKLVAAYTEIMRMPV